jgi:hypothetical protein
MSKNEWVTQIKDMCLEENPNFLLRKINLFQSKVLAIKSTNSANALEILLNDLAYDLDFFEPVEAKRLESPSYKDSKEIKHVLRQYLNKMEHI